MGFSVTATHVIFFVAFLSAASLAAGSFWQQAGAIEEARREESTRHQMAAHTNITLVGTPTYDAGASRYTFNLSNEGSTVLNMSRLSFILDGLLSTNVENTTISGIGTTEFLMPGETAQVNMKPIPSQPSFLKVTTEHGVSAYYRS